MEGCFFPFQFTNLAPYFWDPEVIAFGQGSIFFGRYTASPSPSKNRPVCLCFRIFFFENLGARKISPTAWCHISCQIVSDCNAKFSSNGISGEYLGRFLPHHLTGLPKSSLERPKLWFVICLCRVNVRCWMLMAASFRRVIGLWCCPL